MGERLSRLLPCILFMLATPFGCIAAEADDMLHNFSYFQQTRDGVIAVCGVEHSFVFKDEINDSDVGSMHLTIEFVGNSQKMLAFFKFQEGTFKNGLNKPPVPNSIGNASVVFGGKLHPLHRSECQDDDMSFCGGIGGDDAGYLAVALSGQQDVRLVFNRRPGQLDYSFDIGEHPTSLVSADKYYSSIGERSRCMLSVFSPK